MVRILKGIKDSRELHHGILTEREIEYLTLAALGCENLEIAAKLVVSLSTVKKTLENIFQKLKARNRTHAVSKAFTLGILTPQLLTDTNNTFMVGELNSQDLPHEIEV